MMKFNPKRIEETYQRKGFIVAEDLGLWLWLSKLVLWCGVKNGDLIRCSTVVDYDGRTVCFHDKSILLGHADYPHAHVEIRYTLDLNFFRSKIWSTDETDSHRSS